MIFEMASKEAGVSQPTEGIVSNSERGMLTGYLGYWFMYSILEKFSTCVNGHNSTKSLVLAKIFSNLTYGEY